MKRFYVYSMSTGSKVILARFSGQYAQLDAMRYASKYHQAYVA